MTFGLYHPPRTLQTHAISNPHHECMQYLYIFRRSNILDSKTSHDKYTVHKWSICSMYGICLLICRGHMVSEQISTIRGASQRIVFSSGRFDYLLSSWDADIHFCPPQGCFLFQMGRNNQLSLASSHASIPAKNPFSGPSTRATSPVKIY